MNPLNILLIGLGNMGKVHKRVIENDDSTNLYGIVDISFKKKHEIVDGLEYFNDFHLVNLDDGLIDAVVISSTTSTHYKIAEKFLAKAINKHEAQAGQVIIMDPKTGDNFQEKVRKQYLKLASVKGSRFIILDGALSIKTLHETIWEYVKNKIKNKYIEK